MVILDIGAPRDGTRPQLEIISDLSRECFMPLSVGGAISSINDIRKVLLAGADKTVINSFAFEHPEFITQSAQVFGSQCIVVSIDVKKLNKKNKVCIKAGKITTDIDPVSWAIEAEKRGAGEILLTSIDRDGTMSGYNIELIREVSSKVNIPVIACGGAGNLDDFVSAIKDGNASAVSAASIFLYTQVTPMNVKKYLKKKGIETRI